MTTGEAIEQFQNAIDLIKQIGEDWLDERDIPMLEMAICALKNEQTDGDLISRQALLQKMWNDFYKMEDAHEKEQGFEYIGEKRTLEQNGFECAIKTVSEFPSAEKAAKWEFPQSRCARCSYCGHIIYETIYRYCPNCGSKMKGEE